MDKRIGVRERPGRGAPGSVPEGCLRFVDAYSDYRDARLDIFTRASLAAHLGVCPSCRRYDRVVRKGVEILRDAPTHPSVPSLQLETVRDRAWALEREEAMALGTSGSGMSLVAAVSVALLLGAVAWSPFFVRGTPEVELPAVVAGAPPRSSGPVFFPPPRVFSFEVQRDDLGEIARSMLFEYQRTGALPAVRGIATAPDSE